MAFDDTVAIMGIFKKHEQCCKSVFKVIVVTNANEENKNLERLNKNPVQFCKVKVIL